MDKITKVTVNGSTYQLGGNPDVSGFYKITVTLPTAPNSSTLSYDGYTFPIGAVVRVQDSNSDSGYAFYRLHDITNGSAVWSKLDGGLLMAPETVTVHVASNQATDTDLVGVATVTVNGETQTYNGSDLVFYVNGGTSYTITAGSVSNYTASNDSTSTYTAVFMNSRTANVTYNTEVVTVTSNKSGATLKINGNTYTSPVKIAYGTAYVVTGSAITGYDVDSQTITASLASRTVTVTYTEQINGVNAIKADGTEVSYDDADSTCVGVVVRDSENRIAFFIDKRFPTGSSASTTVGNYKAWSSALSGTDQSYLTNISGAGSGTSISGAANSKLRTNALNDYKSGKTGVVNTNNIVNDSLCSSETAANNAAKYCRSIQNPATGDYDGYLGSVEEWIVVNDNQKEINKTLEKIGGVQFAVNTSGSNSSTVWWTSSERSSNNALYWYWSNAYYAVFDGGNKSNVYKHNCARPFFPLNTEQALIKVLKSDGTEINISDVTSSNKSQCIGVVVREPSKNIEFVIGKEFVTESSASSIGYNYKSWSSSKTDVSGITNITASSGTSSGSTSETYRMKGAPKALRTAAFNAYANGETGIANTNNIVSTFSSDTASNNAAKFCQSKSLTINGVSKQGYLGSLAEWIIVHDNHAIIDQALTAIDGVLLSNANGNKSAYYWTSSERDSSYVYCWFWYGSSVNFPNFGFDSKNSTTSNRFTRPFFPLN